MFRYEPAAEDCSDAADNQDAGGGVPHVPRLAAAAPPLQPQPQLLQRPGQDLSQLVLCSASSVSQ